jgi:alkylhydroperoxidase/carboxymuconolactone decarboxylase family protein YurZ
MPENPLKPLEKLDPQLLGLVNACHDCALDDGALPKKTKLLIAMALDAAHGTVDGVQSLAVQAMKAGATKEEVMETLRVAFYISGAGAIYTAARALKEVFPG